MSNSQSNKDAEVNLIEFPFKVGDTIKNYGEMCEILGEKKVGGNSKIAQLDSWRLFFEWEKEGYSFVITKVLTPHFIRSSELKKNTKKYYEDMQKILLSMLRSEVFLNNGEAHYVSKSALIKAVGLSNDNYFYFFGNQDKLVDSEKYKESSVEDFYTRSYNMFKRDVRNILDSLKNRALIDFSETYVVSPLLETENREYSNVKRLELGNRSRFKKEMAREATDEEVSLITESRFIILTAMGLKDMRQVYMYNRKEEFQEKFDDYLFKQHRIANVYRAYKIWFPMSVALYLEEHHDKDYFKISSKELNSKRLSLAKLVRDSFNDSTEKVIKSRESEESELPYNTTFQKNLKSLTAHMAGAREQYQIIKFRNEIESKSEENRKKLQEEMSKSIEF